MVNLERTINVPRSPVPIRALWRGMVAAWALAAGFWTTFASGEIEAYLRLSMIDGQPPVGAGIEDASVPTPAGWFPIQFTGHSIAAASSWLLGGGAAVGKPVAGDFTFTKNVNFASPALLHTILTGSIMASAEMVVRHAGAPQGPFYSVLVKEILVLNISPTGVSGDERLTTAQENVALTYRAIEWSYRSLDANGAVAFSSTINWNQASGVEQTGPLAGVPRQDPYVAPDQFVRFAGNGLAIPIETLLGNDAPDAGFDQPPFFDTALGGKVSVLGSQLIYAPPSPDNGEEDHFSYAVRNQAGRQNAATVTISVRKVANPKLGLMLSGRSVEVHFSAETGLRYQLQFADRLGDPWTDLGSPVSADANGQVNWIEALQPGTRYYRAFVVL